MPSGFARADEKVCGLIAAPFHQHQAAPEQPREQEPQQGMPGEGRSRRQAPRSGQTFYGQDERSQDITAS